MTTMQQQFIECWAEEHDGRPPSYEWAICGACRGHGSSSAHLGAFTMDEMHEMGEDFREDYLRGVYDQPCDECGGTGKVQQFSGEAAEQWFEWEMDAAADLAVRRAESGYQW